MKCELCEKQYKDETLSDDELEDNYESIRETGRCCDCFEEWGEEAPDRI